MSKQLYEEALADVKKLKEVAEDNAKRALLEAVTPRIKDLIENQLIGEATPEDSNEGDEVLHDAGPSEDDEPSIEIDGDTLEAGQKKDESDVFELSVESAISLGMVINSDKVDSHVKRLQEKVRRVKNASSLIKESKGYVDLISSTLSEVENTYSYLQKRISKSSNRKRHEAILEGCYSTLSELAEQKMMNRRRRYLNEADITLTLTGLPDEIEDSLDDISVDLMTGGASGGGDEEEEEGGDEELDLDLGDEEGGDEEEEEGGEEEEEGGDEEEEELDLDLGDEDEEEGGEEEEEEAKQESRRRRGENMIVEIDEGMLRREISRMRSLRESKKQQSHGKTQSKHAPKGHGYGDVSDDFEDDDHGDPLGLKLRESDSDPRQMKKQVDKTTDEIETLESEMEAAGLDGDSTTQLQQEVDEPSNEGDEVDDPMKQYGEVDEPGPNEMVEIVDEDDGPMEDKDPEESDNPVDEADDAAEYGGRHGRSVQQLNHQSRQPGATVESVQRRIRREIRIQMEAQQKARNAQSLSRQVKEAQKQAGKQAKTVQSQKRQGKKALPQTEKQAVKNMQKANKMQKQLAESYAFHARRYNASVARVNRLRGLLSEAVRRGRTLNGAPTRSAAGTSHLRTKLAETNLFNTKLLFTNKLLQLESLTKRQKAAVIERLDEARSEREVKLVYESLVRTLQGQSSGVMTESVNRGVMGSSSRPARPASTLNEGFETERWARLAGIVK